MKLLVTAGGGGHFSPALSVLEVLGKNWEVLIVGRKYALEGEKTFSLEYQIAKNRNLPFVPLTTGKIQRKFTRYTIPSLIKIPFGLFRAFRIVSSFKPDAVLLFGGYVSFPVAISALLLRIPIIIHEQTLGAGLANKIISSFAQKICVSWPQSLEYFPKEKTILTGNPIRKEIIQQYKKKDLIEKFNLPKSSLPIIYITGGSSGSHTINEIVKGCIEQLLERFLVIHQTGETETYRDFLWLEEIKEKLPLDVRKRYVLKNFFSPSEVGLILQNSDLVVSRGGVNTISELIALSKMALIIPLSVSSSNEQIKNALFFKELGLGEMARQESLTSKSFFNLVTSMIEKKEKYKICESSKDLIKKDAVLRIVKIVKSASFK